MSYIETRNLEYAMEDAKKAKELLERTSTEMDIWDRAGVYFSFTSIYALMDEPNYEKASEYGLTACRIYEEEKVSGNYKIKRIVKNIKNSIEKEGDYSEKKYSSYSNNINFCCSVFFEKQ